jgi:hypothetical protein
VLTVADATRIAGEPVDEVVPNLLAAGEKVIVAGPPKQLKTWFALHFARCVAAGEPVLNDELWRPDPQPVLFVQEEGARQRWASRVQRTFGDVPKVPFRYIHRERFSLANREHIAQLAYVANQIAARVIIVDPWQRVTAGIKENDAAETGPAWDAVHNLASDTNAAVVVLHHTRKDGDLSIDALRGSSRMAGEVDLLVVMKKVADGQLQVNIDGREYVRPDFDEGNLVVMYDEPPWRMRHEGFAQTGKRTVKETALTVLTAARGHYLSVDDIHGRIQAALGRTCSKESVRVALNRLLDDDKVVNSRAKGHRQALEWAIT